MNGLIAPIQITKKGLLKADITKESIDSFLMLLLNSVCGETPIDPKFGFVFNNMRFEIFNEREGVIFNSVENEENDNDLYSKKISGNSRNLNTFATDLKEVIMQYEPRLEDIATTMSYVRSERKVYITVTGIISESKEKYQFETTLKIWN
jgi:hypothetical protein